MQNANSMWCSQAVTHLSTDETQHCFTSLIGRETVRSTGCGPWRYMMEEMNFNKERESFREEILRRKRKRKEKEKSNSSEKKNTEERDL